MATIRLSLDKHNPNSKGRFPVRLIFSSNSKTAPLSFGIFVKLEDWDAENEMILSSDKKYKRKNSIAQEKLNLAERFIDELSKIGRLPSDPKKLRDMFTMKDKRVTFTDYFSQFAESHSGTTRDLYVSTLNVIKEYFGDDLQFSDITPNWLTKFDAKCTEKGNKINTRNVYFRNIRAVFNSAINNDIISLDLYPFRKFKIKKEATAKRALIQEEFSIIYNYEGGEKEMWAKKVFLLSFYLLGINMKDLYYLKEIHNDRVIFNRAKTNRLYDIKVEPEAMILINDMKGVKHLLNFADQFQHHENFLKKVNEYLDRIAKENNIKKFTTYACRHSWATYAANLDIPKETISAALGHNSGSEITSIYIDFNKEKIDVANRQVIDFVKSF